LIDALTRRKFFLLGLSASVDICALDRALPDSWDHPQKEVARLERARVIRAAQEYLAEAPRTITCVRAARSAGGIHDYFSEGDYWWPDPKNPNGPYIRRDGESNPANFVAHRDLLIRLSIQMPALTAAWLLTRDRRYAEHAVAHLRAWFVDAATRMNPNLEYAQAIHGIDTGRSIGIIDTVHLVEVAQAAAVLERTHAIAMPDLSATRSWFAQYLFWLTNSDRGRQERDAKNNHGSCWLLQAAEFAAFTGDRSITDACRRRLTTVIFPGQIAADGSFPLELARTKPYSYSLFNLDILGMIARVLSTPSVDLWTRRLPDGRGLALCFQFMFPFMQDKQRWPYRRDVEYFADLPVRQPSLLFAGLAYSRLPYLSLWQRLNPDPTVPEVIRNHPIRQPLLWMRS
jgi:hypothetical protein